MKSETPNTNIQAKPKVVGGNGDYTVPPKNTKTINTPSGKVDATPNKSINSNVNTDVKSVDVETKGTVNVTRAQLRNLETLDNIVNKHLTDKDFSGTLRDLQGILFLNLVGDIGTIFKKCRIHIKDWLR